jgi:cytochrome bd-type quinol oxidase subunit 1
MTGTSPIDWTQVILTAIITVPAILSALFAFLIHRAVQTPSGSRLGQVAELTHDLSAVDLALTKAVHAKITDGEPEPETPRPLGAHTRKDDKP